ncbi:hypothetical protein GGS23DRAFT_549273 [Durotheca rogersii]|uniref:uncharacterized protein n=1 Tax=Durotheca rogersii TaxID=419775 RepID=UPI00221F6974|nr:uncharacterized protein GGS23DRAFT_549273 [Durotheca rogersii]KAI5867637.1 hypothetical protein GGS23DRAFT_549273 [Durotheca rogersii]
MPSDGLYARHHIVQDPGVLTNARIRPLEEDILFLNTGSGSESLRGEISMPARVKRRSKTVCCGTDCMTMVYRSFKKCLLVVLLAASRHDYLTIV